MNKKSTIVSNTRLITLRYAPLINRGSTDREIDVVT